MNKKELIRNIGIIAHIDHGKTTLADSLLAGAGMLSPQMAGTARVLDYLAEEQKRKITIKTANMSLLYQTKNSPYIINLVDTPGHVDFTGKVTRALRVIDGAVVVVDAVEEIMAQTEILVKQALEERVRPMLFINKVDRLITELQLDEAQIQNKLDYIISRFNDLIELYAEEPFKNRWKIDPTEGNVAFGAALYSWGFTLEMARRQGIKFSDIIKSYTDGAQQKLQKALPIYEAIFEMAIKHLPNPQEAQGYRIEKIWGGELGSEVGRALVECKENAPIVLFVTSVRTDLNGDTIVTGRVFSGTIKEGDKLHLMNAAAETEVIDVALEMGLFREEVNDVSAGNLASATLAGPVKVGETLVDLAHKERMVPFEGIRYVSEPVVTVAVEPKNPQDIPALLKGLERLAGEDPNLKMTVDNETGEYLLSGMGELHLEIAVNELKRERNVEVAVSSPRVLYVERVQKSGIVALARSPNKQNSFYVQVEPNAEKSAEAEKEKILTIDDRHNTLIDCSGKARSVSAGVLDAMFSGFEFACKAGPLCSEPVQRVRVNLVDFQLGNEVDGSEIMRGIGKAVFGSFLTAEPVLLEPIYKIVVTVASELASESTRILTTRRGKVTTYEQKGLLTCISGNIPVSETFGFAKEIRSATSGKAIWQTFFDHWGKMSKKIETQTISELRQRKGLAPEVPKPEKFLEQ